MKYLGHKNILKLINITLLFIHSSYLIGFFIKFKNNHDLKIDEKTNFYISLRS